MKIAIPDMISNSYFPAAAAVELGFFKQEGLDMELELIFHLEHARDAIALETLHPLVVVAEQKEVAMKDRDVGPHAATADQMIVGHERQVEGDIIGQ